MKNLKRLDDKEANMFLLELILNVVYLYLLAVFIILMVFAAISIPIWIVILFINFVSWLVKKIIK